MTRKPAPMADDVLELTRKCLEALELPRRFDEDRTWILSGAVRIEYDPANDQHQAFDLLCWLAGKGEVVIDFPLGIFHFIPETEQLPMVNAHCTIPAELRLAIMRAVVKMKEDQDGR